MKSIPNSDQVWSEKSHALADLRRCRSSCDQCDGADVNQSSHDLLYSIWIDADEDCDF